MSGYTPVFDSVFHGTLCGKYPDLPVWLILLALANKYGEIDAHPSYIATVSGLPQADIELAIERFCQPDPASRTHDEDGRRLVPLPNRGFGWTIVNHGKYREKARKAMHQIAATASGRDAERKRLERAGRPEKAAIIERDGSLCGICAQPVDRDTAHVDHIVPVSRGGSNDLDNLQLAHPRCNNGKSGGGTYLHDRHPSMPTIVRRSPAGSGADRLSYSDSYSDTDKEPKKPTQRAAPLPSPEKPIPSIGLPAGVCVEALRMWETWLQSKGKPVNDISRPAVARKLVAMGDAKAQSIAVESSIAGQYLQIYAPRPDGPKSGPVKNPYRRKSADELEAEARSRGEDPYAAG